jgi:diguanylate cyclase (GGDEF)-like protein
MSGDMNADRSSPRVRSPYRRGDFIYSLGLFVSAAAVLAYIGATRGILAGEYGWRTAAFFFAYALFTITMGYARPGVGHVSFDRAAQVASILVLGPFDAAWINGLASLVYPWHRLRLGMPLPTVLTAALNNAGMMSMLILGCGSLYVYVGGPVPLAALNMEIAGLLLLLVLAMQLMNDFGMLIIVWLRNGDTGSLFNVFSTAVELVSSLIAVVIALVMVRMDFPVFALLLVVLSLGMLVLKSYAEMRLKLEALVDERTLELRQKSLELERQATHDKLTGIFNRRYADDFLQREIENAKRHSRELTVALADIDHFKRINDDHSHAAGDAVLRIVARILTDRCRKTDVVARYGGEEFLLCFPDTSSEFAEQICAQIRAAVENADWSPISHLVGEDFGITISFGIAEIGSDSRRTTVLNVADGRLYEAKRAGRNRIVA